MLNAPIDNSSNTDHIMVIDREEILPGTYKQVRINVSRLPSGTRIYVQCHVFRSDQPGPTVLILAGVHGDEINGIEAVRRLLNDAAFEKLNTGSIILIPLLNVFGFINFSREVPDGKDVNRSFPGSRSGSLAARVAHVLTKKILPLVDYAIDLHTGGASRYNYPQVRYNMDHAQAFEMAKIFGAPFLIAKKKIAKSFRKIATDMGVIVLVYEAGESVRLDGFSIEIAVDGIKRILKYLNMIDSAPAIRHDIWVFRSTGWVRASEAGLFIWTRRSGGFVRKGELLGVVHSPQGDRTKRIFARADGYIIGHNNASVVHNGDALFHIGYNGTTL